MSTMKTSHLLLSGIVAMTGLSSASESRADNHHHYWWGAPRPVVVVQPAPVYVHRPYYYQEPVYYSRHHSVAVDVQVALRRRGYYRGPIDGDIGPGSREAIRAYQYDHRLRVTGYITDSLLRSLGI